MAGGKIDILVEPDLRAFPGKLQSGLQASTGIASGIGSKLGLAIAGGLAGAAVAFKEIISLGNEYQGKLNELQAVTAATGDQMAQVGERAKELGSDTQLVGVSAADAAGAMLELAKGGLSVDEAMVAAKGTLQLAGAAQIEGARAAEIQAQALNQFGLAATDAGRVADTLANTANAASGGIEEISTAMKYVGPVAASMSISIEDTATAIGLLANNGILADTAGTSLRGMLVSLASPSKKASEGINALGITAFDSQGKFVGFRSVIDQLSVAQGNMTEEQFASAAAMAFGREPLAAITALAREGGPAFDEMRVAVGRAGGAQEVAAAKAKGLGGAMESFKSTLETVGISIYEMIDGPLETLVRSGTEGLDKLNTAVGDLGKGEFKLPPGLTGFIDSLSGLKDNAVGIFNNIRDAVRPVADAVGDFFDKLSKGDGAGPLTALAGALLLLGDAAEFASGLLVPIGGILGGLIGLFADLPGPIQTAALALLALKAGPTILSGLSGGLRGVRGEAEGAAKPLGSTLRSLEGVAAPATKAAGGLRQFNDEMRVQRQLAAAAGEPIGRLAGYQAAFETSTLGAVAALRNFRDDVRTLQAAAEGAGQPISGLSAAIQALGQRSPTIAAMASAFTTTSSAIRSFSDTAAAGARDATQALGTGLVSAVNNTVSAVRNLPSAVSGAASSLRTGLSSAASAAGEAVRSIPTNVTAAATSLRTGLSSAVTSAASSLRTGLSSAATAAADAVRSIPTTVSSAMTSAGDAVRRFPTVIGDAFRSIPGHVQTGVRALGGFAATAGGLAASAGTGIVRGLSSLTTFLGGPWGVALAAAGVALSIFGQHQADAAKKADEQRQKVDELAGSFDKLTGAASTATKEIAAQELTSVKLSDGTTTLNAALTSLGINTRDYVDATTGNVAKQQEIAEKLNAHTKATLENSNQYKNSQHLLKNWGLSIDDITAAVNGNIPAQERMMEVAKRQDAIAGDGSTSNELLAQSLLRLGGASAEVSKTFGAAIGTYNEAKTAADATREATQQFADALGGLKDLRVFEAIAAGAPVTKEMAAGMGLAADAAIRLSTEAGKTVAGVSGVGEGANAARLKMEDLRKQFIDTATAAGLGVPEAEALANSYGLIPSSVETIIRTNATGVQAEMITLNDQIKAIPPGKDIIVRTLSDDARAQLEDLGFKIENMPDGSFKIIPNTAQAKTDLDQFVALANGTTITMTGDMNTDPATGKITQTVTLGNGQTAIMTYDANPNPADGKIHATVDLGNGQTAALTYDANPDPATGKINATVTYGNGQKATILLDPNDLVTPAINAIPRTGTTVWTISYKSTGYGARPSPEFQAKGGIVSAMHDGGVIGFAGGGHAGRKLRPMRGGIAQVVPPNTWRVVGDRLKDDEAYIPINRSARSRRIFEETARRMGYAATRMYAEGGMAESRSIASNVASRGGSPDVVAAIATLESRLAGVQQKQVEITNQFFTESSARDSDTVARTQRQQASMGLFR